MWNSRNIVLLIILAVLFSCQTQQKLTKSTDHENFDEFSKKFYADSNFQLSRINFPLKGLHNIEVPITSTNILGDSMITGWKKSDWKQLKNGYFPNNESSIVINNTRYFRKIQRTTKSVTIKTYIENSGFSVTEKYSLKKSKWYLTYFSSMNY